MARALVVPLTEEELQELTRVLLDRDEPGALAFLRRHMKPALHQAQDGGLKPALGAARPGRVQGKLPPRGEAFGQGEQPKRRRLAGVAFLAAGGYAFWSALSGPAA